MILLSGGVDSASLLALVRPELGNTAPGALFVDYGQPAATCERSAAQALARAYEIPLRLASADIGPIATGEVPGRNALLVHLALALAPQGPVSLFLGIHAGTAYVDCTPAFVEVMQASLDLHRAGEVRLAAPFLDWSKTEVYTYARAEGVPLQLTYSCEAGTMPPCGTCLSCSDRRLLDARA
jgi:7-cyano-7-deazaguanine synthase